MVYRMSAGRELVMEKIEEISEALQALKNIVYKNFRELEAGEKQDLRRLVIVLSEAASIICSQILLGDLEVEAGDPVECIEGLRARGVIPGELAEKLVKAADLRRRLIQEGGQVDDKLVYDNVKEELKDFERFTMYVRRLLRETE